MQHAKPHPLRSAATRYTALRATTLVFATEHFQKFGVCFSEISLRDATSADQWEWSEGQTAVTWEWRKMYSAYHSNAGIKRFDVAIHHHARLLGLCYGVPSRKRLILKLHALAGAPQHNPLKGQILNMIFFAANAYARLVDAKEIWVCNPVNTAVVKLYESRGLASHYNASGRVTHLSTKVTT